MTFTFPSPATGNVEIEGYAWRAGSDLPAITPAPTVSGTVSGWDIYWDMSAPTTVGTRIDLLVTVNSTKFVKSITVDWGDSSPNETITKGFGAVQPPPVTIRHTYTVSSATVTVTANYGDNTTDNNTFALTNIPSGSHYNSDALRLEVSHGEVVPNRYAFDWTATSGLTSPWSVDDYDEIWTRLTARGEQSDGSIFTARPSSWVRSTPSGTLEIEQIPAFTYQATGLRPGIRVRLFDLGGDRTSDRESVWLTKLSGPGSLSGTLSGYTDNGVVMFPDVSFSSTGVYSIQANSNNYGTASGTTTVSGGSLFIPNLFNLSFPDATSGSLGTTTNDGQPYTPAMRVHSKDTLGNLRTTSGTVTLSSVDTALTSFSGTLTSTEPSGEYLFNDLVFDQSAAGVKTYKFTAQQTTLFGIRSADVLLNVVCATNSVSGIDHSSPYTVHTANKYDLKLGMYNALGAVNTSYSGQINVTETVVSSDVAGYSDYIKEFPASFSLVSGEATLSGVSFPIEGTYDVLFTPQVTSNICGNTSNWKMRYVSIFGLAPRNHRDAWYNAGGNWQFQKLTQYVLQTGSKITHNPIQEPTNPTFLTVPYRIF